MSNLVLIHGTWGRAQPWHLPGSVFHQAALARGFTIWDFLWSGILAGVLTKLPGDPLEKASGADVGMLLPWLDAGEKLVLQLKTWGIFDDPDLRVFSHSHGLQVWTYACVKGAQCKTAVSVSGPVRDDVQRARRIAMARIGRWVQFADPTGADKTIVEGEMFNGHLGATFALPEGETIDTPGTGHHGLLVDAAALEQYKPLELLAA